MLSRLEVAQKEEVEKREAALRALYTRFIDVHRFDLGVLVCVGAQRGGGGRGADVMPGFGGEQRLWEEVPRPSGLLAKPWLCTGYCHASCSLRLVGTGSTLAPGAVRPAARCGGC